MSDAYLKSAAQLRELATRVTDREAQKRIIAYAKEYEAISAALSAEAKRGRKRTFSHKEPILSLTPRTN